MDSHYVMHYTISSLYTVKKYYLSNKGTVFHFTRISLYTIYFEKQKSCKVRATCITSSLNFEKNHLNQPENGKKIKELYYMALIIIEICGIIFKGLTHHYTDSSRSSISSFFFVRSLVNCRVVRLSLNFFFTRDKPNP